MKLLAGFKVMEVVPFSPESRPHHKRKFVGTVNPTELSRHVSCTLAPQASLCQWTCSKLTLATFVTEL